MTPMQKIEEAWELVCDKGKETMFDGIKATGKNNRLIIRIPYTTIIGGKIPAIRVTDWSTPMLDYDLSLTGWYSLRQLKEMIKKYGFELTKEE